MLTKFIIHGNKPQIQCTFLFGSYGDIIKQISKTPLIFIWLGYLSEF